VSAAAVAVFALVTFWPVRHLPFISVWDDGRYVSENAMVRAGLTPAGLWWSLTTFDALNWHPLTWVSHMLDVELFGMNAGAHHLSNLAYHLTAALLLLAVLVRLTGRVWPSALVSVVFAVHPLHVESVVRVSERKDVLSALFWMLTIAAYLRYVRKPKAGRYLLVVAAYSLGLMAKPMVVTLPLVLLLLDFWPLGRFGSLAPAAGLRAARRQGGTVSLPRLLLEKVPLLALAASVAAATWVAQSAYGKAAVSLEVIPLPLRLANAAVSAATYLGNMLVPRGLAFFYPYPIDGVPFAAIAGAGAFLAGFSLWAVHQRARRPYLVVGWAWYAATPGRGALRKGSRRLTGNLHFVWYSRT
jgi:hypothetical protein